MTTSYTPPVASGDGSEHPPPAVQLPAHTGNLEALFGSREFPVPDLLPPAVLLRRKVGEARRRVGIALLAVVAILLGLFAVGQLQLATATAELESAQMRLQAAEAEMEKYSEVPAVYAAVDAARAELTQAMGNEVQVARLVSQLSAIMPPDVSLTEMSLTIGEGESASTTAKASTTEPVEPLIGTATFSGEARTFNDVSAWIDTLRNTPDYTNVILTDVSRDTTSGIYQFTSTVELTDQALSGRYVEAEE